MRFWSRFLDRLRGAGRPESPLRVVVYTRQDCHLCDEAAALLRRHGLRPRLVDIDPRPELRARYDHTVPVVEIDGKIRFRGRVNPVLLRRLLRHLETRATEPSRSRQTPPKGESP